MNTDQGYYTPKYNELRLGDSVEHLHSKDRTIWEPALFDSWDLECFKEEVDEKEVRVRLLDHEQLIADGWVLNEEESRRGGHNYSWYDKGNWILEVWSTSNFVILEQTVAPHASFNCRVKSLNQLKYLCEILGEEDVQPQAPAIVETIQAPEPDPHTIQHQPKEKWSGLKNVYRWLQGQ